MQNDFLKIGSLSIPLEEAVTDIVFIRLGENSCSNLLQKPSCWLL